MLMMEVLRCVTERSPTSTACSNPIPPAFRNGRGVAVALLSLFAVALIVVGATWEDGSVYDGFHHFDTGVNISHVSSKYGSPPRNLHPNTVPFDLGTYTLNDLDQHPEAVCELAVLAIGGCRVASGKETAAACVKRVGPDAIERVLPRRCRSVERGWPQLKAKALALVQPEVVRGSSSNVNSSAAAASLSHDIVFEATVAARLPDAPRYIPPSERPIADFSSGGRQCRNGCQQYPISFGIPAALIVDEVPRAKWWGFTPMKPAMFRTVDKKAGGYPFFKANDEWIYREIMRRSMFSFTHKRGGWDCLRHLEILASGAVPYWADIDACPRNTLANYPKKLLKRVLRLPSVRHIGRLGRRWKRKMNTEFLIKLPSERLNYRKPGLVNWTAMDMLNTENGLHGLEEYYEIADALLNHTKKHLTTIALAGYVLKSAGYEEPRNVLVIGKGALDYLYISVVHGLAELGLNVTLTAHGLSDQAKYPPADEITSASSTADLEDYRERTLRGKPMNFDYDFRMPRHVKLLRADDRVDPVLAARIRAGEFDLVIYGYAGDESAAKKPYWSAVEAGVPSPRQRIFINHHDDWKDPLSVEKDLCRLGTFFKREMHDADC